MYMFSLFVLMIFSILAFKRFILCKRLRAPNGFPIFCDVFNNPICVQIFVSPYLLIISIVHLGKFQIHFSKSDFLRLQQIIKNLKELCTFITFGSSKCRSSCKLEYALLTWQAVLVTRAACPRPSRRRNRLPWSRASRRSRGTCRLWQGIYSSPHRFVNIDTKPSQYVNVHFRKLVFGCIKTKFSEKNPHASVIAGAH